MQESQRPKRNFNESAAVMLVTAATITGSAAENQAALEAEDTTCTLAYLTGLEANIDAAVRDILGADNAAALRRDTDTLETTHTEAYHDLGLTKILIESKYSQDHPRRDELLNTLGFRANYTDAARNQAAMSRLLNRFADNLTPDLEDELSAKGLPAARVARLRQAAGIYTNLNVAQEGQKGARAGLTDADVLTLNGIHSEVMAICKMAQRLFKGQPALRDRFVYDKVAGRQSSYHTGHSGDAPTPPPAA